MGLWQSDGAAAAAICCSLCCCALGALLMLKMMRSNEEEEDSEAANKPQRRFKLVLADNSPAPFVHLSRSSTEVEEDLHPYGEEIKALVENPVVAFSEMEHPASGMEEPFIWVETREGLQELADILSKQTEFAVDTEQHSIRSFLGFTALVQISTYERDYVVDAIVLHDDMYLLRPVFANPSICKVFHGADSDILWLQRDFHIYVVNLFDTARACDVLGKPQRSLAYLLQMYCNISTNKVFQKSDWRQRPLPEDMLLYARTDAHFLLYIARQLYNELLEDETDPHKAPLLELAMRRSQLICLQLYEKDGAGNSPAAAAASLLARFLHPNVDKAGKATLFRKRLRLLCEWRDSIARSEDESLRYVLSDAALVALAKACPLNPDELYSTIATADDAATNGPETFLLPSPSPLVKKHIDSLILMLGSATESGGEIISELESVISTKKGGKLAGVKLSKANYAEIKRMQFVKKFSCKGLVYENCRIYAGDGRLLCYCDRKKLEWYFQRGLAESLDEDPPAIRLRFEPKGRPEDENNEFYIQSKTNQCVGCGESSHYLRYRIIPSCYRQHFPEYMKSHRSHDIVLLCVDCHEKAHRAAEKYKHVISTEYGIPLFARKIVDAGAAEDVGGSIIEGETGVSPLQLRNAAMALLCHAPDMPENRREELEMVVSAYFGGREIDEEDMKAAALVGIDPKGQKRLIRKIDKVLKRKRQALRQQISDNGAALERSEENAQAIILDVKSVKTSKISLLGHGLHGKKVVEKIWEERGEEGIRDFIQKWRQVFVDAVHPSFLPPGWEVTHSGRREFGEYSVYRPKWLTRT